jgi:hypothetical protein
MKHKSLWIAFLAVLMSASCARTDKSPAIYLSRSASVLESFGAAELRRYLYLLTGRLAPLVKIDSLAELNDPGIIVDQKSRWLEGDKSGSLLADRILSSPTQKISPDNYRLKTIRQGKHFYLLIAGHDGPGILYGIYAFVEKLGVRFTLEGDVVPEEKITFKIPVLDETGRPLFKLRGIQPFHDFAEGPDWWNEETYKAILGQLPKLGMNFFGLHTYPEGGPNAEPTVWIGLPDDLNKDGRVINSYPASYQNTLRANPGAHNWGYQAKKTSDFHFGASELFERDDYGVDIMEDLMPEPKTPEQSNELFDRTAAMFRGAFSFAKLLGVQTCVGTETPLTIPALVRERLKKMGKNPKDPGVVQELYKGIFQRIASAYPLDYFWFWTNEGWTWSDASSDAVKAVTTDLEMAIRAAEDLGNPFKLATCGWVLGPPSNRTLFDQVLPKNVASSCINREVGKAPVEPNFALIEGRSKWAIPWLEDDPSLTSPQLWVGRMRRDAADALRYGCDGLLGIHWRTRILSANTLALAKAAWDQSWNTKPARLADLVGPLNGRYVTFTDKSIAGTNEEAIYKDIRDRVYAYHLPVPDGTYIVTLKFCEGEFERKGARLFDILIQGSKVAEKVDIYERAGRYKALDLAFQNVKVTGGKMFIDFGDRIHYPSVAGIVIEGTTGAGKKYVKKINCGGPKILDYEADWPETPRHLASLDFYRDWAKNQFGMAAANEISEIFAKIDGKLPIPVNWTNGPGGIVPDKRPWLEVQKNYRFVDELGALKPRIKGKGYEERFDYWLGNFEYMREIAHFNCLWAEYNKAWEKAKGLANDAEKAKAAGEDLLPLRTKMVNSIKTIFGHLLATISNMGELGIIANWEQHLLPDSMEKPGEELKKLLGGDLPAEAQLSKVYDGPARMIVPTVRTSIQVGEHSKLKVIILAQNPPQKTFFYWRQLGQGNFKAVPLRKLARSVYTVDVPAMMTDIEYYLEARVGDQDIAFPSTAPDLNQTIVVIQKNKS